MKKPALFLFIISGLFLFTNSLFAQFFKIDTSFYSPALKENRKVSLYLPHNYYQEHDCYYPVVYFLHGWGGNQNALDDKQMLMSQLLMTGQIEPMIVVCADNSCQPFGSGVYVNSVITGNFEDLTIQDLIPWVDENFRTIAQKEARAVFGQSLGGYGAFRFGILHKDKFRAISAHAAPVNYNLWMPAVRQMLMFENSGPPYFYNFYGFTSDESFGVNGFFTRSLFLASSGFSPDPNSNQYYINPQIIQFPFDQNCNLIDSVFAKWAPFNIPTLLSNLSPADSVSILYGCGLYDETMSYYPNYALQDTLDRRGLSYEFFWHKAGHVMPSTYFVRSLIFLDSLLLDYSVYTPNEATTRNEHRLEVSPNPFSDFIDVGFVAAGTSTALIELIDLKGNIVKQKHQQINGNNRVLSRLATSGLKPGTYLIRVTTGTVRSVIKVLSAAGS